MCHSPDIAEYLSAGIAYGLAYRHAHLSNSTTFERDEEMRGTRDIMPGQKGLPVLTGFAPNSMDTEAMEGTPAAFPKSPS